jgi:type IV secretory pathway VirB10-like protein
LIEQRASEVSAQVQPDQPTTIVPGITTDDREVDPTVPANSDHKYVPVDEHRSSPLSGKSLQLIGTCAAALLIALVLIIALSHKRTPSPKTETAPSPVVSVPLPPAPPPSQPATPVVSATKIPEHPLTKAEARAAAKEAKKREREQARNDESKLEPKPEPKPAPRSAGGRCDLDQQEIPEELDTAERSLARGLYNDAERQFGAVLGCEPGNGRARAGLERVKKAQTER